jgi:hypothetical protein
MLDDVVAATTSKRTATMWEEMLRSALGALKSIELDDLTAVEAALRPLDRLTACAPLARALGAALHAEAAAAATYAPSRGGLTPGAAFEARAALAPLLAFSALPGPGGRPSAGAAAAFRRLKHYPRCAPGERLVLRPRGEFVRHSEQLRNLLSRIQLAFDLPSQR